MTNLRTLLGIDLLIIQAPMAGVQGSALAVAVSNAGEAVQRELLLPCAAITPASSVNWPGIRYCGRPESPWSGGYLTIAEGMFGLRGLTTTV